MRISVVGAGYVGLVSGACFAELGHESICVDLDARKVDQINAGTTPIHETGLAAMLARHIGKAFRATTDLAAAVLQSDITFIAVGTPFDGTTIDLTFVRDAAQQIGTALRQKDGYHAVVVKSTVVPSTTDTVVRPILELASGKCAGRDFGLGMNPEFLTEGVAVDDFMRPDRIVIGGIDARSVEIQRRVYAAFTTTPVLEVNNSTAEMIKYASNSVLATLISFSNEMGRVCSALGNVDVTEVMQGVHLARYFNQVLPQGQRVKAPITAFLWAGCGYGGSCLPKDTKALSAHASTLGEAMPLLEAVIGINESQPSQMIRLLDKHFPSLSGLRVCILGIAFKEDTDDVRESPAIGLARSLLERGALVSAFDPVAKDPARAALPHQVQLTSSLEAALDNADAALLVTRWSEFQRIPELLRGRGAPPLIVDGRRFLDPSSIARYEGIGR